VVHRGGSIAGPCSLGCLRNVGGKDLYISRQFGRAAPIHGSDAVSSRGEVARDRKAKGPCPEDHLEVPLLVHLFVPVRILTS